MHFTLGQWSVSWRRWYRVSFSVVLSLFLPHLRTLAQEKRSEICLRFGTSGPSLCLYPLLSRIIILFPRYQWLLARKQKFLAKRFAHAIREHCRDLEHAYVYWIWLRGSTSYVITLFRSRLIFRLFCGVFCHLIFIACYNRLKKIKSLWAIFGWEWWVTNSQDEAC